MIRLLVGIVIGLVLGATVSAWAQVTWSSYDQDQKNAYIAGLADGIVFTYNENIQGHDFTKATPYVGRCVYTDSVADHIIHLADYVERTRSKTAMIQIIVTMLAECGGLQ